MIRRCPNDSRKILVAKRLSEIHGCLPGKLHIVLGSTSWWASSSIHLAPSGVMRPFLMSLDARISYLLLCSQDNYPLPKLLSRTSSLCASVHFGASKKV
jgi:hypothetical protein